MKITLLCPTLYDTMDCSLPGSSVYGIPQARILEWVTLLQGVFPTQGLNLHLLACWLFTTVLPEKAPLLYIACSISPFSSFAPLIKLRPVKAVTEGGYIPLWWGKWGDDQRNQKTKKCLLLGRTLLSTSAKPQMQAAWLAVAHECKYSSHVFSLKTEPTGKRGVTIILCKVKNFEF